MKECSSIKEKLSAYLEDAVSHEERGLIEEHLKSCAGCSADLADLRKTIEHIMGLEEVEPPAWMTQKIMAELREEARRKKGILQRLFYPLHIKLPLEAVATVLVVGIALYLYRSMGPETGFVKAPTEESAPQILKREIPGKERMGPSSGSELKKVPQEITKAPAKPAQGKVSGKTEAKTDSMEESVNAPEPPRPMPLMREKEEPATSPPANAAAPSAAGALNKDASPEAVQTAQKLKASAEEKVESLVLTVKVRELESASKEVEKIIAALGGKIIERQSLESRRMFVIDLNAGKFEELFEKLKLVGDAGEKGPSLKGREGNIRMRIEAVQTQQQGR